MNYLMRRFKRSILGIYNYVSNILFNIKQKQTTLGIQLSCQHGALDNVLQTLTIHSVLLQEIPQGRVYKGKTFTYCPVI